MLAAHAAQAPSKFERVADGMDRPRRSRGLRIHLWPARNGGLGRPPLHAYAAHAATQTGLERSRASIDELPRIAELA
jgi:hypothetical protein